MWVFFVFLEWVFRERERKDESFTFVKIVGFIWIFEKILFF